MSLPVSAQKSNFHNIKVEMDQRNVWWRGVHMEREWEELYKIKKEEVNDLSDSVMIEKVTKKKKFALRRETHTHAHTLEKKNKCTFRYTTS